MSKKNKFFDPEKFEKGKNSLGEAKKFIPTIYASEVGLYLFRPYLEECEDQYRFFREIRSNQLLTNKKFIAPSDEKENKISSIIEDAVAMKVPDIWKHKTRTEGVGMVYLLKAPKKYEKYENKAVCLVFQWQHVSSWNLFKDNFDPVSEGLTYIEYTEGCFKEEDMQAVRMIVSKETKGKSTETSVQFSLTNQPIKIPSIDECLDEEGLSFEGLDKLYVPIDKTPSEEDLKEFKNEINEKVSNYLKFKEENQYEPKKSKTEDEGYVPRTRKRRKPTVLETEDEEELSVDDLDLDDDIPF